MKDDAGPEDRLATKGVRTVVAALLLLLLIALLFGVGLAVKAAVFLVWVAVVLAAIWLIGWFVGANSPGDNRWYSW
jgi:uncharacterized membrane protein